MFRYFSFDKLWSIKTYLDTSFADCLEIKIVKFYKKKNICNFKKAL